MCLFELTNSVFLGGEYVFFFFVLATGSSGGMCVCFELTNGVLDSVLGG